MKTAKTLLKELRENNKELEKQYAKVIEWFEVYDDLVEEQNEIIKDLYDNHDMSLDHPKVEKITLAGNNAKEVFDRNLINT